MATNALSLQKETLCRLSDDEMVQVEGATAAPCMVAAFLITVAYDAGTKIGAKMKQATW